MNLVIDKRKTNIIYVDKDNNHVANNNDIIKLIATNNTSAIDAYVKILAGTYNLNDTEIAVLKYLIAANSNELAGISSELQRSNQPQTLFHTGLPIVEVLNSSWMRTIDSVLLVRLSS